MTPTEATKLEIKASEESEYSRDIWVRPRGDNNPFEQHFVVSDANSALCFRVNENFEKTGVMIYHSRRYIEGMNGRMGCGLFDGARCWSRHLDEFYPDFLKLLTEDGIDLMWSRMEWFLGVINKYPGAEVVRDEWMAHIDGR